MNSEYNLNNSNNKYKLNKFKSALAAVKYFLMIVVPLHHGMQVGSEGLQSCE